MVIGLLGTLDAMYMFLFFWPAKTLPIWLLISMLQFFIPLNMLLRSCCMEGKFNRI